MSKCLQTAKKGVGNSVANLVMTVEDLFLCKKVK